MQDLISVVIPTHNRAHLIKRALYSVMEQSYTHLEIIVVNDASVDDTSAILNELSAVDTRIKIITNKHAQGGSASRNKGLFASNGIWTAFLDDDDTWQNNKLEKQLELLKAHPKAIACSSAYTIHYPFNIKKLVEPPSSITIEQLLMANILGGTSVCMAKTSICKEIGGFDPALRSAQDWDFWVKLLMSGEIVSIQEPLVNYYVHFNARISNNMHAKYLGARRFYFKYKHKMSMPVRDHNIFFLCFIRSRQQHRGFRARLKNLYLAIYKNGFKNKFTYFLSSMPRIFMT